MEKPFSNLKFFIDYHQRQLKMTEEVLGWHSKISDEQRDKFVSGSLWKSKLFGVVAFRPEWLENGGGPLGSYPFETIEPLPRKEKEPGDFGLSDEQMDRLFKFSEMLNPDYDSSKDREAHAKGYVRTCYIGAESLHELEYLGMEKSA